MRLALLTFVMLAAPAVAETMTDPRHDAAVFGEFHEVEVSNDQVDLVWGEVAGSDGAYAVTLHLVDLAPMPSNAVQEFHAEAVFRTEVGGRVLASLTVERDGDLFAVGYASDQGFATIPTTASYDPETDEIAFAIVSPYHVGAAYEGGARAALFECVVDVAAAPADGGRGCARAWFGPETGLSTVAVYDAMGSADGQAFVKAGG